MKIQTAIKAILLVFMLCFAYMTQAEAAVGDGKKIIYIPHDSRPISNKQTAEVVRKLGYEVIVPPDEILGNRENLGTPEKLWAWLEAHAKDADAAVISSDSMLYGSLVGSRKHRYTQAEINERVARFHAFHAQYKQLPTYVFGSIMRTPRSGEASGHEEPTYYRNYGADIFRYTLLKDKEEVEGLTRREKKEYQFLERLIPKEALADWLGRRNKNFTANKKLIDLAKNNAFSYFVLGRDDNAPYSQTHMESRHLADYGKELGKTRYQNIAGIDEVGMLLLTRAVNDMEREVPFVYVRYNWGRGENTVPTYSDEKIKTSIGAAIAVVGAMPVPAPERADLVLAVNTNPNGKTMEANDRKNDGTPREGTKYFADIVAGYIASGYPTGIADIAYANGADNALLEELKARALLFKLRSYAGWNTATNSTGFVIGAGVLTKRMNNEAVDDLLITRYLDDWAYQANIRNTIARQLTWLRGDGVYGSLDGKKQAVSNRADLMFKEFVQVNLPPFESLEDFDVRFPWNRMFEADIVHRSLEERVKAMVKVNRN